MLVVETVTCIGCLVFLPLLILERRNMRNEANDTMYPNRCTAGQFVEVIETAAVWAGNV